MATTPGTPETDPGRRRRLIIIAVVAVALLIAVSFVAAYLLFFGSEAPEAPSIENAIKVLLPSAPPE
ncbi:MAG: hypothetical protein U9O18_11235 [Chloroflexota bacterium]|nr:hypothetical protein [Chloroflexota bacterium]